MEVDYLFIGGSLDNTLIIGPYIEDGETVSVNRNKDPQGNPIVKLNHKFIPDEEIGEVYRACRYSFEGKSKIVFILIGMPKEDSDKQLHALGITFLKKPLL